MTYEFPPVTIGIITYRRVQEIQRTVDALVQNVTYRGELRWLIADDSSPDGYVSKLKRNRLFKDIGAAFVSTVKNSGWGVNANNLLKHVDTDYVLFLEDDYVLTKPLDLSLGVALLEEKPHLGLVRYRGTAGDHVIFHQFQADMTRYIPDFREAMGHPGGLTYLQLDGHSPTAYLYSNGPHLKHRRFHAFYGEYPEGKKLGDTEETMAVRVKSMMQKDPANAPGIVVLPAWVELQFDHIGASFQNGPEDN